MSGWKRTGLTLALGVVLAVASPALSHALGTAFTYQGQLQHSGAPANGTCDFRFSLYDEATAGTQIGASDLQVGVAVEKGLFTVLVNEPGYFGPATFDGSDRWLEAENAALRRRVEELEGRFAALAGLVAACARGEGSIMTALGGDR